MQTITIILNTDGTVTLIAKWPNIQDWQNQHGKDVTFTVSGGEVNEVFAVINGQLCKNGEPV